MFFYNQCFQSLGSTKILSIKGQFPPLRPPLRTYSKESRPGLVVVPRKLVFLAFSLKGRGGPYGNVCPKLCQHTMPMLYVYLCSYFDASWWHGVILGSKKLYQYSKISDGSYQAGKVLLKRFSKWVSVGQGSS